MYHTEIVCFYNTDDIFEGTENLTDADKEIIRDEVYRNEFLYIFGLTDYNDEKMAFELDELYNKLKTSPFFREIMKKSAAELMSEDEHFGIALMYSYEYMYLTHKCVCEFLTNNLVPDDLMNEYYRKFSKAEKKDIEDIKKERKMKNNIEK